MGKTATKGVAWNTASNVVEKAIVLANVYIALTYLTIHEYGLVQLVLSFVSVASIALLPGFADAIIADLAVEHGRADTGKMKEILLRYNSLIMLLSALAWAVFFFGSNLIVNISGGQLASYYLKIASFMLLVSPLRGVITMLFTVSLKFRELALYSIVEEIWKLGILLALVVWLQRGPEGLLYATMLSQVGAVLVFAPFAWPFAREIMHAPEVPIGPFWKSLSRHRMWSIANSYIGTFTSNLQIWIVKVFLGTDAVALYSVAQGLLGHVTAFMPLSTTIVPILPRYIDRPDEFRRVLRTSLKVQFAGAVTLVAAGALGGLFIVEILFPKYIPALPLFWILLIGLVPGGFSNIFTPVFATLKRQGSYFYSSVIKTILMGTVFPLCIWAFGLWGAAAGNALTSLLSALERNARLKRTEPAYAAEYANFFSLDAHERALTRMLIEAVRNRWTRIFS